MSELSDLLLKSFQEPKQTKDLDLFDYLKRMKIESDFSANNIGTDKYGAGIAGGGRLGLNLPLNDANLNIGATGSGAFVPKHKVKDFNIDRVDASYNTGKNNFSLDFDPKDIRNNFMINYKRDF